MKDPFEDLFFFIFPSFRYLGTKFLNNKNQEKNKKLFNSLQ